MPHIDDDVFDNGLSQINSLADILHICSTDPGGTYATVTANSLGNKATPTVGSPTNGDVSGRKVVVSAITDGSVTGTGTASHWALCDVSATRVYASGALSSTQAVTSGNTFTLTAIDITIPDAS
jgi:hypothetical protein